MPLSGLLNLDHPKSQAVEISDKEEAIQNYVYSIKHPEFGTYLVDTGEAAVFADESQDNGIGWLAESAINMRALDVLKSTEQLEQELGRVGSVFLTHIHMGHIMGLCDLEGLKFIKIPGMASCPRF